MWYEMRFAPGDMVNGTKIPAMKRGQRTTWIIPRTFYTEIVKLDTAAKPFANETFARILLCNEDIELPEITHLTNISEARLRKLREENCGCIWRVICFLEKAMETRSKIENDFSEDFSAHSLCYNTNIDAVTELANATRLSRDVVSAFITLNVLNIHLDFRNDHVK